MILIRIGCLFEKKPDPEPSISHPVTQRLHSTLDDKYVPTSELSKNFMSTTQERYEDSANIITRGERNELFMNTYYNVGTRNHKNRALAQIKPDKQHIYMRRH